MMRAFGKGHRFTPCMALLRRNSTLNDSNTSEVLRILQELKSEASLQNINPADISSLLSHKSIDSSHPKVAELLAKTRTKGQLTFEDLSFLYNATIIGFAHQEYSLAAVAMRAMAALPTGLTTQLRKPTPRALIEIIKYNPGRVASSWEIFRDEIHTDDRTSQAFKQDDSAKQALVTELVNKLLYGDASEIEDGYKANDESLAKIYAVAVWSGEKSIKLVPAVERFLVEKALSLDCPWVLRPFAISADLLKDKLKESPSSGFKFATLLNCWWMQNEINYDYPLLLNIIPPLAQYTTDTVFLNETEVSGIKRLQQLMNNLNMPVIPTEALVDIPFKEIWNNVTTAIADNGLDCGASLDAFELRNSLISSTGIYKGDLAATEDLVTLYTKRESAAGEHTKSVLSVVYCYHACTDGSAEYLQRAESLLQGFKLVPVRNLQALILANSYLGRPESSLQLFNKNVGSLSKTPDPSSGHSAASAVTESLILSYLFNLDREFAYLIHDGATENGLLKSDQAIARAKNLFKLYGEAFEDEDETKAKTILGSHLLEMLKHL